MSAAALTTVPAEGRDSRPGLGRLAAVELRKMIDTRAGFWLQLVIAALTVVIVTVIAIWGEATDQTFKSLLSAAVQPASILGPIVGILLVSSEWSQRTAQITFTLVPRRSRVLGAKVLAGVAWCAVAFAASVAVAAVATALGGAADAWDIPAVLLFQDAVYVVVSMLGGIAFGAALLASAPAIVLSFVLPIGWSIIGSFSAFAGAARWLDGGRTLAPLVDETFDGTQWARALTTLALWVLLPMLIGLWRITRGEVR